MNKLLLHYETKEHQICLSTEGGKCASCPINFHRGYRYNCSCGKCIHVCQYCIKEHLQENRKREPMPLKAVIKRFQLVICKRCGAMTDTPDSRWEHLSKVHGIVLTHRSSIDYYYRKQFADGT